MKIKAIIFDLDDTLQPKDQIRNSAVEQSMKAMIEKGLNCSFEEGIKKIKEIEKNPRVNMFCELAKHFGASEEIWKYGHDIYNNADFDKLEPFPKSKQVLTETRKKGIKNILVSQGSIRQQDKKISALGLRKYLDHIFLCKDNEKEKYFSKVLETLNLKPEEVIVVGDNIPNEIKIGNKLKMTTIRIMQGKYKVLKPKTKEEKPDYVIDNIEEVLEVLDKINNQNKKQPKIVAIGGGTGLPTIIEGLRKYTDDLTMIVTVTDSGRSSGILRKELEVLPPGDIRNCLISLSNSEKLMGDLFQYRFENGSLEGHNFGNLFIAALTKLTGSFEKAVEEASKILKLKGKVLPSTLDNTHVCAKLEDGTIIEQEDNIIDRYNKLVHLRSPIKEVYLKPEAKANELALKEIEQADLIVLCPGSLYTSIITNLLVKGISKAITQSKAKKVYICNIMSQQSQTHNYKASDHIKQIIKHLNSNLDYTILNTELPKPELIVAYKKENAHLIENDPEEIEKLKIKVIAKNLLDKTAEKKILWEKKDLLRHDPDKIAEVLISLIKN